MVGDHSVAGPVSSVSEEVPSCNEKSSPKHGITKQKKGTIRVLLFIKVSLYLLISVGIHGCKANSFVEVCNVRANSVINGLQNYSL